MSLKGKHLSKRDTSDLFSSVLLQFSFDCMCFSGIPVICICNLYDLFHLFLAITQAELMKELAPHVAPRWYMFAVLLNISKPILDKISKGFMANMNVHHSLSEVVEAWVEKINVVSPESSTETSGLNEREPSRYWLQVYHVVKRMGHVAFARELDEIHGKLVHTIIM